jgi:methionine-rich copper-binding protein CopC
MRGRISLTLVIALLLSMMLFSVASAHAELESSDPTAGANLSAAPAKVTLVFSEEISDKPAESFFNVTDEAGATVGTGKLDNTDLDHKTLSGTLNPGLGDGVYTVTWQTLTPDDNGKSEGSFKFGVNKAPGAQPTAVPHSEAQPTAAAAQPTVAPAAAGAGAQPTATPHSHEDRAPAALPTTGAGSPNLNGYLILGALCLLVAGLALMRSRKRA